MEQMKVSLWHLVKWFQFSKNQQLSLKIRIKGFQLNFQLLKNTAFIQHILFFPKKIILIQNIPFFHFPIMKYYLLKVLQRTFLCTWYVMKSILKLAMKSKWWKKETSCSLTLKLVDLPWFNFKTGFCARVHHSFSLAKLMQFQKMMMPYGLISFWLVLLPLTCSTMLL